MISGLFSSMKLVSVCWSVFLNIWKYKDSISFLWQSWQTLLLCNFVWFWECYISKKHTVHYLHKNKLFQKKPYNKPQSVGPSCELCFVAKYKQSISGEENTISMFGGKSRPRKKINIYPLITYGSFGLFCG